jgi:hypothetical protein
VHGSRPHTPMALLATTVNSAIRKSPEAVLLEVISSELADS